MRLDHISYVASHNQISDVIQRIGATVGSPFIDGGIHPKFGTRNFILPLRKGRYFEVVCPLEHPSAETSPFGRAVNQRANEGGGWLTWVVSTNDLGPVEKRLNRKAVISSRKRPDGIELEWKQIGVLGTLEDAQLPFFIQWLSSDHPSKLSSSFIEICKLELSGEEKKVESWLGTELSETFDGIEIEWTSPNQNDGETGIVAAYLSTPKGIVRIE